MIDGTKRAAFMADVIVRGDKISEIVPHGGAKTSGDFSVIDAKGCLVTPGFIDAHSHSDAYLIVEPDAPSKVAQGVTTEVNGQCGGSVAPRYGEARLSSDWAAILGERLTWRSLAEYRAVFDSVRPAINSVQFIGHNTLRSSVVGYDGRAATDEELRQMQKLLEASLDDGGWGLSTGLIYQPGKYSTPDEVLFLAKAAAKKGALYSTHMRSESDGIIEALEEVENLARASGIRAEISHLKTSGKANWHKIDDVIAKVDASVKEGIFLGADRYPYCAAGTDLDVVLPDWAQVGAAKAECERLKDSTLRSRIIEEINASGRDWASVMVGGTWAQENKTYCGLSVADALKHYLDIEGRSVTPGEFICDLLLRDGCKTGAFFFGMCEENLAKIYSQEWVVPGSDASLRAPWGVLGADHPHPRAYGTMPEFYRRVREIGLSREEAVARMTSQVASRFGISLRGTLQKGAFADIVVWRENEFASKATYTEPHSFSTGVKCVMVNGVVTYKGGQFTGIRNGRFLER